MTSNHPRRRTSRFGWHRAILLLLALSLVAAACGSDTDAETADPGTTAPAADDGSTEDDASEDDVTEDDATEDDVTEDNTADEPTSLVVSPPFPPESLDPHGATSLDVGTRTIANAILDPLVRIDGSDFVPALAESWENPDPTTWVFHIREGVTFHDGSALTSADVVASLQRVIDLEGPLSGSFTSVTGIEATDDLTVTITTDAPYGPLLGNMSLLYVGKADGIGSDDYWSAPIGTGPFVLDSFSPGERVLTNANADYWAGPPKLDQLEFQYLPDEFGRATALETGDVDITWRLSDGTLERLADDSNLKIESVAGYGSWVIWVNASGDETSNKLVRQAMWHAVDWQQIIDDLFPITGKLATSAVSESVFGYSEQTPYEYNPEKAKELLAEAGYPDGVEISAMFREGQRLLSLAAISYWADAGITVEPLEKVQAVWLEDLLALNFEVNLMVQSAATGDADVLLGRLYPCDAERTGYCNEELDALLAEAKQSTDPAERLAAYDKAIALMWDEVPGIFPIDVLEPYAMQSTVTGFVPDPSAGPSWFTVDNAG